MYAIIAHTNGIPKVSRYYTDECFAMW